MIVEPWPSEHARERKLRGALLLALAITVAHLLLGERGVGGKHLLHVALAALYLWPIALGASARGARGGVSLAALSSGLYLLHVLLRSGGSAVESIDALAVVAGYGTVGALAGLLSAEAERRRDDRDRALLAGRRGEEHTGLLALHQALAARDAGLARHSREVGQLARLLGRRLGLEPEGCEALFLAGLVHDVGKLGLRDDVLFSNGGLDDRQRREVHGHPLRAAELVLAVTRDERLAAIVRSHHECPDGSGYPDGLAGAAIPPLAGVLRVADVLVALTESRTYRASDSLEQALATMRSMAPEKLDVAALQALQHVVADGLWPPGPGSEPADDR